MSYSRRRTARVGVDRGPKHGPPAVTRPRRVRVVGLTRGTRLAPLGVEGGRARLSTSRPAAKARPEAARGLPRVERQRTAARPRSPLARTPSTTPRARARVWVHTADLLAMDPSRVTAPSESSDGARDNSGDIERPTAKEASAGTFRSRASCSDQQRAQLGERPRRHRCAQNPAFFTGFCGDRIVRRVNKPTATRRSPCV